MKVLVHSFPRINRSGWLSTTLSPRFLWIVTCGLLTCLSGAVNAQLLPGKDGFGSQQIISSQVQFAMAVHPADLDGDGDVDVLSASIFDDKIAWYENDGEGTMGPQQIITSQADGANDVHAADLDGDGDLDVVSSSQYDGLITWYINEGDGSFGPRRVLIGQIDLAKSVHVADLDGDGDLDVLTISLSNDEVVWFVNDGGGSFGSPQLITTLADHPIDVHPADLDGDGDMDVLSASAIDDKVAWYENDGLGNFGAQQIITTQADLANSIHTADLDGDGDLDVLSSSNGDQKIAWYENDGSGNFGAQEIISGEASFAQAVHAADLDGDGDQDVLGTSRAFGVYWYANDGRGNFTPARTISTLTETLYDVRTADLDGDGDLDILSASYDDKVAWYANQLKPKIAEFLLVNTAAERIVRPLGDGSLIDVAALQLIQFSVMAVSGLSAPTAVRFHLSGPITRDWLDQTAPFTLFGENSGAYLGEEPLLGEYTLTATPIRYGLVGGSKTIHFRLVPSLIEDFTLVNADDELDIQFLTDGAVIDPAVLGGSDFSIQAYADQAVVRVDFDLSGPIHHEDSEFVVPYLLFGDDNNGYRGEEPLPGDYTLTVIPYTAAQDGSEVAGHPQIIHFSFEEPSGAALRVYPNQFEDELFVQNTPPNEVISIRLQPVLGGASIVLSESMIHREEKGWRLDTQHLAAGHYLLQLIGTHRTETRHVIRE